MTIYYLNENIKNKLKQKIDEQVQQILIWLRLDYFLEFSIASIKIRKTFLIKILIKILLKIHI